MRYYMSINSSFSHYSLVYSVDKCVVVGFLELDKIDYLLNSIDKLYYMHLNITADYHNYGKFPFGCPDCLYYWSTTHYENRKNLSFYHNFNFEIKDGLTGELNTFWLGLGFNRFGKVDYTRWKIEFNPNKVLPCDFVENLFQLLSVNSYYIELKEFDIAVDFPISRDMFSLSTVNGRKYSMIMNSEKDKTEYSGTRHTNGFTKVYNKTIESKLDYSCSRLEFTFTELNFSSAIVGLPDIFITDYMQLKIDTENDLNDTEKFILHTLLYQPDRINELGRYMKSKMKNILESYVYSYTLPEKDFYKCIDILKSIDLVKRGFPCEIKR